MQDQGPHHDCPACADDAGMRGLLSKLFDLLCIQHSERVRSGNHAQRPIIFPAIIQMQADRQHIFQNLRWRLHMLNARLDRPWATCLRDR